MARKAYWELLRDPRWQRKRLEVMERAGFRCEQCNAADKTLNVHHRLYRKGADPWDYADSELQCLCEGCHEIEHGVREGLAELMAQLGLEQLMMLNGYAKGLATGFTSGSVISVMNGERASGIGDYYGIGYVGVMELMDKDGNIAVDAILERLHL